MKMKPTITVADNGNLQIHIPMLIRRMRGRKTVIAPQALDGEITGAQEPVRSAILQALARAFSWADILESGQIKSISELARTPRRRWLVCGPHPQADDPGPRHRRSPDQRRGTQRALAGQTDPDLPGGLGRAAPSVRLCHRLTTGPETSSESRPSALAFLFWVAGNRS